MTLDDLVVNQGKSSKYEVHAAGVTELELYFRKAHLETHTFTEERSQNAALVNNFVSLAEADYSTHAKIYEHYGEIARQTQLILDACMKSSRANGVKKDIADASVEA